MRKRSIYGVLVGALLAGLLLVVGTVAQGGTGLPADVNCAVGANAAGCPKTQAAPPAAPKLPAVPTPGGGNGGGGLVAARHLLVADAEVEVHLTDPAEKLAPTTAEQLAILERMGVPIAV